MTTQYTPSVFNKVKGWLEENNYPTKIIYENSKGSLKTCVVVYQFEFEQGRDRRGKDA